MLTPPQCKSSPWPVLLVRRPVDLMIGLRTTTLTASCQLPCLPSTPRLHAETPAPRHPWPSALASWLRAAGRASPWHLPSCRVDAWPSPGKLTRPACPYLLDRPSSMFRVLVRICRRGTGRPPERLDTFPARGPVG